ncbi:MAG: hypothetical protein K2N94_11150 [Lachnospiraceae bacterium]|nr:hypothetical protein [Lachnospiraceae bacterium]
MADLLEKALPKKEQDEIREFVAILRLLPKEDRAVLLSNANAFKLRGDIERMGRSCKDRKAVKERQYAGPEDAG